MKITNDDTVLKEILKIILKKEKDRDLKLNPNRMHIGVIIIFTLGCRCKQDHKNGIIGNPEL